MESSVSLNGRVSVVPAAVFVMAVEVGGVRSRVELFVITTPEKASMFPLALPIVPVSGDQLAVTTAPDGIRGEQLETLTPWDQVAHFTWTPFAKKVKPLATKPLELLTGLVKVRLIVAPSAETVPPETVVGPCVD